MCHQGLMSLVRMSHSAVPSSCLVSSLIVHCRWTMDHHVANVVRGCNYHIRTLRHIWPLLDLDTAKMLAQEIAASRLDYCNSLMCGMSNWNFNFQAASGECKMLSPGQCVVLHGSPAPPNYVARCTSCLANKTSTTRSHSSLSRHDALAARST